MKEIINHMLAHARRKRKIYWGVSKGIYAFYDTQIKTLEDLKGRFKLQWKK